MGGDRRGGAGPRPKSFTRWLRCTLLANGITVDLPLDDAVDVAAMLVNTGRAQDPAKWIESCVDRAEVASFEGLF